jgi:hypothetical protein
MPEPASSPKVADARNLIAGPEPTFVLWRPERAEELPELVEAISRFDPGKRPAAVAAAEWLREHALREPLESATRLCVASNEVLGFYSLANGAVVLRSSHRKKLGTYYPTQPAVVVTWIAKSAGHEFDGSLLLDHAIGAARRVAQESAATVLALDPYDLETAEMWRSRFGFRNSLESGPASDLPRLFLPLTLA